MRQKIVAGNWKMHKTLAEGEELLLGIVDQELDENVQVIVIPPFIHLPKFSQMLSHSPISVGAQNCHHQDSGAFTGEISAEMLKSVGVDFVVLGHSERRQYFFEDSLGLAFKVRKVIEHGLRPIYCCGETMNQRNDGEHFDYVRAQIREGLFELNEMELLSCIVAYEPIWAIGTGVTASPAQAQEMHSFIRKTIASEYGEMVAENVSIIYGGSVKPANAVELFNCPDIDGGLIGGAALSAESFASIINSF